jgi:polyisoprenoid-binding protein YceI
MKIGSFLLVAMTLIASAAQAAHWSVDYAKSRLSFTVQWSGQPFVATFKSWKADIDFDPADLARARVAARIDLASEGSDTPDNDTGLKGGDGFSTDRFPSAQFEATHFIAKGAGAYVATGTLSLHGVSRTVVLPFGLTIAGDAAHAKGHVTVLRTDFGLGTGEWAGPTPIAHEVDIDLDLTATKTR